MSAEYQPGVCNIGRAERRVRYGFGGLGFVVGAGVVVAIPVLALPDWWLLASFVPLFVGFIGYYQGREAFCVRFALAEVYNVTDELGPKTAVADDQAARHDRRRARRLVGRAALVSLAVTVAIYLAVPALTG